MLRQLEPSKGLPSLHGLGQRGRVKRAAVGGLSHPYSVTAKPKVEDEDPALRFGR